MDGRVAAVLVVGLVAAASAGSVVERHDTSLPPDEKRIDATRKTEAAAVAVGRLAPALRGTEWERIPTRRRVVALTFDACGNDGGAERILRTLERERVPATFFLCGRWVDVYPARAKAIALRHAVGNHSATHPHVTALSDARVREEVVGGARAIRRATPADPAPLFRFPYGDRDARTLRIENDLGYGSIRWTVDTLGWKGVRGGQSATSVHARVLAALRPGAIVLMHVGAASDGTTLDAAALPAVIDAIRDRGYGFVGVYRYATVYRQVVDDASARFAAGPAWRTGRGEATEYGATFRYASPTTGADAARFALRVPQTATYVVSAWWPADRAFNAATPVVVDTLAGSRTASVDQRRNGGRWTTLGTFRLRAGDVSVRVLRLARGRGFVVADAVRIRTQ